MRMRQPDLGAAFLEQRGQPGTAIQHLRRDTADAASALVARQGFNCRHAYTIKWRRTSGRSRSAAGPECMISPRSMM